MRCGVIFVINVSTFLFKVAHSKAVVENRLRKSFGGNIVITWEQRQQLFLRDHRLCNAFQFRFETLTTKTAFFNFFLRPLLLHFLHQNPSLIETSPETHRNVWGSGGPGGARTVLCTGPAPKRIQTGSLFRTHIFQFGTEDR